MLTHKTHYNNAKAGRVQTLARRWFNASPDMNYNEVLERDKYKNDVEINKGRQSANTFLKYNTTVQKYM